jgi:hypothetical protein
LLRFGSPSNSRHRTAARELWRMWMLFALVCLVLWFMRMLEQPATVERIDALLNPVEQKRESIQPPRGEVDLAAMEEVAVEAPAELVFQGSELVADELTPSDSGFDMSAVRDNTFFRAEENPAWFAILDKLRQTNSEELNRGAAGEVAYAQFLDQPDDYRGKVVTIRGTAMREETLDVPANGIGLQTYHRLVIRPTGGGVWPIIVYSLELPDQFPRGSDLREEVEVRGIFFKNWSYSWKEGLGLAPVILAKTVDWQPVTVVKPPRTEISVRDVLGVIAGAMALAATVGWLAWRHTRRSDFLGDLVISLPPDATEAQS